MSRLGFSVIFVLILLSGFSLNGFAENSIRFSLQDSEISFRLGDDVVSEEAGKPMLEVDAESGDIITPQNERSVEKTSLLPKLSLPKVVETKDKQVIVKDTKKTRRLRYFEPYSYELDVEATYYFYHDVWPEGSGTGLTCRGNKCIPWYTVAVDPKVIPLGSKVYIEGKEYLADDTGGAIQGNKIDIAVWSREEAFANGRRRFHVKVVPPGFDGSYKVIEITSSQAEDADYIRSFGADAVLLD